VSVGSDAHRNPVTLRYAPGSVLARFSHGTFDYIELDLRMGGETTWIQDWDAAAGRNVGEPTRLSKPSIERRVYFSSLWCAFPSLVRFLEAIAIGVDECAFTWDPEGPFGEMRWHGNGKEGTFTLTWSGGESFRWSTRVCARDLVQSLYGGFRSFVESDDYDPMRYEQLRRWDMYALVLADAHLGQLARALANRSRHECALVLHRLDGVASRRADTAHPRQPLQWFLDVPNDSEPDWIELPAGWDGWTARQRMRHLGRQWRRPVDSWSGSNLRKLKSRIIEDWLARRRSSW
jgi:hypothetical protein